ncbi:MAG: hypothetical protein KDD51_04305 [Bdellovibrionales bacterium]|nr:hypothetical protein [Bdellovibrionales bacterium]
MPKSFLIAIPFLIWLAACSSSGNLLEKWSEEGPPTDSESLNSPEFQQLSAKLDALGYQGVGLSFETPEVQKMLTQVFSDPRLVGRKIRLLYTGLAMSYDPKQASLTIGGSMKPAVIVDYIQKHVPLVHVPRKK